MPDPVAFMSASPRHEIPLLFAGQSQREFFINEAHALIDALLHPAIEGTSNTPPPAPAEGDCWLVGDAPTAAWSEHPGALASYQAGSWTFAMPRDGMRLLDKPSGQEVRFRGAWHYPETPALPVGGSTIDTEARAAINELIAALITAGLLAQS